VTLINPETRGVQVAVAVEVVRKRKEKEVERWRVSGRSRVRWFGRVERRSREVRDWR